MAEPYLAEELDSCPFCDATWMRFDGDDTTPVRRESEAYVVECGWCHAIGPKRDTEAEAITAWNTRSPAPSTDRMGEELVEVVARTLCLADWKRQNGLAKLLYPSPEEATELWPDYADDARSILTALRDRCGEGK